MRDGACVAVVHPAFSSAGASARNFNQTFRREFAFYEQHTADAFIGCSPVGTVAAWNPGAERIYGYSSREARGREISFLAAPCHFDELARTLEKVRQGMSVAGFEVVQRRKDGSPVQVVLSISPLYNARREVVKIGIVGRDLTRERRAQDLARGALDQYHKLLEDIPCGVLCMDPLGKVLYANRALARILCYSSVRELHQIEVKSKLFPDARAFADFIAQEAPYGQSSGIVMHWYRADRTSIRVRLSSRVISNDRKDLIAYEVFVEDVNA